MKKKARVLVADDEVKIRTILMDIMEDEGFEATGAMNGAEALKLLQEERFDLLLLDLRMPGTDGMQVMKSLQDMETAPQVIIISAHGTIAKAVEATRLGAFDFIEKPVEIERLLNTVHNALKQKPVVSKQKQQRSHSQSDIPVLGDCPAMLKIKESIERFAAVDANVIITGENGTGKDLAARSIHRLSARASGPFIEVNCAALPDHLVESELFGHVRGAFTGATSDFPGKFQAANGGTLFLNEIAEMPINIQPKLLHVLENGYVTPLGSNKKFQTNVRILAATNKPVFEAISNKQFREDLYYRLNVLSMHLPPLRERGQDIPLLAEHFIHHWAQELNLPPKMLTDEAKNFLMQCDWDGNVRQISHLMQKALLMCPDDEICKPYLLSEMDAGSQQTGSGDDSGNSLQNARKHWERDYIVKALRAHNWVVKQTASSLKIERTYLHRLIKQLNISESE